MKKKMKRMMIIAMKVMPKIKDIKPDKNMEYKNRVKM